MRIFDILYVPRNHAGSVHMEDMCLANGLNDDVVAILSDDSQLIEYITFFDKNTGELVYSFSGIPNELNDGEDDIS